MKKERYTDAIVIAIILLFIIFLPESKKSGNETMNNISGKFMFNNKTNDLQDNDLYSLPLIKNITILKF
jgi:hypothetical protein